MTLDLKQPGCSSSPDHSPLCDEVLLLTGVVTQLFRTGIPLRRRAEPSDVLRCGTIPFVEGAGDLVGGTFSGWSTGQTSSVGVPASASTSVRWPLGGLAEFTICAIGGLGRGLLQLSGGVVLVELCLRLAVIVHFRWVSLPSSKVRRLQLVSANCEIVANLLVVLQAYSHTCSSSRRRSALASICAGASKWAWVRQRL